MLCDQSRFNNSLCTVGDCFLPRNDALRKGNIKLLNRAQAQTTKGASREYGLAGGSIPFVLIFLVTFCIKTKSNVIATSDTMR